MTLSGPITLPQSDSVDLARGVARRDLAHEGDRLARCGRPRARCAHLPLAHIGFGGRVAAGILTALAKSLPEGRCRGLVLGSGNTLALLSAEADEVRRGLGDRSRAGLRLSLERLASVRSFVAYARGMLGGQEWASCELGAPGILQRA